MKAFHIDEVGWYVLAQDRQEWYKVCDRSSSGSTSSVEPDSRLYCDGHAGVVLVDHWIRPDTVVAVLRQDVQWAA